MEIPEVHAGPFGREKFDSHAEGIPRPPREEESEDLEDAAR